MDKNIIKRWETNKQHLFEFLQNNPQQNYEYTDLIKILIKECLNYNVSTDTFSEEINIIDHGDYQGTQIFILHKDTYQPDINEYYCTHNYYGSCSGCDTLLAIKELDNSELPSEEQLKGYMNLMLHLIQKMKNLNS